MTQGHFSGCCFVIMRSCSTLSVAIAIPHYVFIWCQLLWIWPDLSQVLWRLRSFNLRSVEGAKGGMMWSKCCIFRSLPPSYPSPSLSASPPPSLPHPTQARQVPLIIKTRKKKEKRWVFKTVSEIGGVRATCEEQRKNKGDYLQEESAATQHCKSCTFFDVACVSHPPVEEEVHNKNCCLSSSRMNKMHFILTPASVPEFHFSKPVLFCIVVCVLYVCIRSTYMEKGTFFFHEGD